jgi:hypothetical protein
MTCRHRRAGPAAGARHGTAGPEGRPRARAQEYEKRLLAKDQEVKLAQAALRRLEAELHDERAAAAQAAAAAAHMLPAPEPKQGAAPPRAPPMHTAQHQDLKSFYDCLMRKSERQASAVCVVRS